MHAIPSSLSWVAQVTQTLDALSAAPVSNYLLALVAVVAVVLLLALWAEAILEPHPSPWLLRLVAWTVTLLACGLLATLSGCGTAPRAVSSCPPVPAELMTPAPEPVPLQPTTRSRTPGATTLTTPAPAQ